MGYRIVYSKDPPERTSGKSSARLRTMIAAAFLVFSILVRLLWPEGNKQLREYLIPQELTVTESAFNRLCEDLQNGGTLKDAVETFCITVIYGQAEG